MFNVMIVEKDPMIRKLIEIYIEKDNQYKIVAAIDNLVKVKQLCITYRVDLILMDIFVETDINSFDVSKGIKNKMYNTKIILMTGLPEYSFIKKAKFIGIDSFWYKMDDEQQLKRIMDLTLKGKSIYPDKTPVVKLGSALSDDFTNRELDVLRELIDGKTDAQIAEALCISVITVKQHIQKLREKTKFHNRTELAVKTRASGLII
ncbi:MAG: response regulator transcription factor [Lachnospiraceae bacterium]|nr:response regulator transcription factor [Lachnospiraceae bacterium]